MNNVNLEVIAMKIKQDVFIVLKVNIKNILENMNVIFALAVLFLILLELKNVNYVHLVHIHLMIEQNVYLVLKVIIH